MDTPSVLVEIIVATDGTATVSRCDAAPAACDAVRDAIAEARFEPAVRDGAPIAARLGFRFAFRPPAEEDVEDPRDVRAPATASEAAEQGATGATDTDAPSPPVLGVSAEVVPLETGARRLTLEEARDMPGALGDPFRALLSLPGVVPVLDGLPYFYLRGSPPSGTVYYYDGIQLPALFHLAAGPAVVHPRMLGALQIENGIAPTRYGRHTGGVVLAEGTPPLPAAGRANGSAEGVTAIGEAQLRLLDVSGFSQFRVGDLEVAVAGRYGYPGPIASLAVPDLQLQYGDYQLRARLGLGAGQRLELVWLGSHDLLSFGSGEGESYFRSDNTLTFQRVELRSVWTRAETEVGIAARFGFDDSTFLTQRGDEDPTGLGVQAFTVGSRFWVTYRGTDLQLRFGGDSYGAVGQLFLPTFVDSSPIEQDFFALLGGGGRRQRFNAGLFGELEWRPWSWLKIVGGVRGDLFVTPGRYDGAIDPRVRLVWDPLESLSIHGAFGVARQPAVFVLPLPGLSELPFDQGLQTGTQSELGATVRAHDGDFSLETDVRGFLHRYEGLLFGDLLADIGSACTEFGLCRFVRPQPRVNLTAFGAEGDLRAQLGEHVSTRLAYTLTFLESDGVPGVDYTPSHDIRHVFNLVLQYDSGMGFTAGVRGFLRSGGVAGFNYLSGVDLTLQRHEQRLPWWGRLDAIVAYAWDAGWARLMVAAEWVNILFALGGEPFLSCANPTARSPEACSVVNNPGIPLPSLGIRGTFQ